MSTKKKPTVTVEIRDRWDRSRVLYAAEIDEDVAEEARLAAAVQQAVRSRASLARASLDGASLAGASLAWASLDGANLARANLDGASLAWANLAGANLAGASLAGANLDGASLAGASLDGASLAGAYLDGASLARASLARASLDGANLDGDLLLVGQRPVMAISPLGSRNDMLTAFRTNKGLRLRTGCFFGDVETFMRRVGETHGDGPHGKLYRAAVDLIRLALPDPTTEEIAATEGTRPRPIVVEAGDLEKYLPGTKPDCDGWLTCSCSTALRGQIWLAKRKAIEEQAAKGGEAA